MAHFTEQANGLGKDASSDRNVIEIAFDMLTGAEPWGADFLKKYPLAYVGIDTVLTDTARYV